MKRAFMLALALVLGCTHEPGTNDDAPSAVVQGDPCNWPNAICEDATSLLWCDSQVWVVDTCDDYCAGLGLGVQANGCDLQLGEGAPEQLCGCEPAADGCYPGQGRCEGEDEIGWCTDEWTWTTSSCAVTCAAQSLMSLGCDAIGDAAACICTKIGTACTNEPPVCSSPAMLSICDGAVWTQLDCIEACGGAGVCDPAAVGGAACSCA